MKMRILAICIGLILLAPQMSDAAKMELKGGIVYGDQHAFVIEAPPGWILDNQSGASQGLHAVFYPKGSSWDEAPAVMYAQAVSKKGEGAANLQQLIDHDLAKFKKESPKILITEGRPLKTADGKTAVVRLFQGDRYGNSEAVAYIDEEAVVVLVVLSSRSQAAFQKSLPAFEKLVASYQFLTDDVRVEKQSKEGKNSTPKPKPTVPKK